MPEECRALTAELRLLKLPSIDLSRIRLTPVEAVVRLNPPTQQASQQQPIGDSQASTGGEARGRGRGARGVTIAAILDRPVYRVGGGRGDGTIVYADDGTVLNGVDAAMAKTIAARFLNISEEKLQYTPDPS